MTVGHRIKGMDILALAIENKDQDVALTSASSTLPEQLLDIVGSVFGFSAVPQGDDVGSQSLLDCRVAETTASEVIGAGSGVTGEEVTAGSDVGDPDQDNGTFL